MESAFGPGSPTFQRATDRLSRIFDQARHVPSVAVRLREWRRSQEDIHGQDSPAASSSESLFIHQTYLGLLARLTARRFLDPRRPISEAEELLEVVNSDYFARRGIGNYGEGDFFSWICLEPRWELGLENEVLETVQGLAEALAPYDFSGAHPGILDQLCRQVVVNAPWRPPRWLAEYIVEKELALASEPDLSLLDPTCGTGVFLSAAIGTISRTMKERGNHPLDILFGMPQWVQGMDRDPLAVALARLNYLLALGESIQQDHPPILVPVYLADAAQVLDSYPVLPHDVAVSVPTAAGDFPLPDPVVKNPMMLDWVLGRLTNYMDAAQSRLHVQSEDDAVQEVMNAYYNYLTAPKARTPVPEPLTPAQADILLETARRLVKLHILGEGSFWLHVVQNNAASEAFARRRFDRLVTYGPETLFEICSSRYLRPQGRAARLTNRAEGAASSAGRRLVSMEAVAPGTALLVTGLEQRARLESVGGPISDEISWDEAKSQVRVLENGRDV